MYISSRSENSYGSIRDKSSLASKELLTLGGVIDKDYTGEIIVIMTSLIEPIKIKKGQKDVISGFFAFFWLIVWADGINKCGWCLAAGRGC